MKTRKCVEDNGAGRLSAKPIYIPARVCDTARMTDLPTSKAEAVKLGVNRYFTGEPCSRGHVSERSVYYGCVACRKNWRDENAGRVAAKKRAWRKEATTLTKPVNDRLGAIRKQAALDGVEFSLTAIDVIRLYSSVTNCPITGAQLIRPGDAGPVGRKVKIVRIEETGSWNSDNIAIVSSDGLKAIRKMSSFATKRLLEPQRLSA